MLFDELIGDVMFVIFVFFFKQKTAYEMRISDWSSDVCSSDLEGRIIVNGQPAVAGQQIDASDSVRIDGRPIAMQRKAEPARVLIYKKRTGEQIGRASCRERVCQYV